MGKSKIQMTKSSKKTVSFTLFLPDQSPFWAGDLEQENMSRMGKAPKTIFERSLEETEYVWKLPKKNPGQNFDPQKKAINELWTMN